MILFLIEFAKSTGELHDLPGSLKSPPSPSGDISVTDPGKILQSQEEGDEETDRFVFYPQESDNEVSPFITDKPEAFSAEESLEDEVEPFTTPTQGERFNLEEFLATNLASTTEEDSQEDTNSGFTGLDYGSWGGAYPKIEEQDSQPSEELLAYDDSLEKIRAIALESYQDSSENPDGSSASSSDMTSDSIGEMIVAQPRKSWWMSLTVFERIIIGVFAGLVLILAGIAGFSANKFWQQAPPPVVIQPTITPSAFPSPIEVVLPGAWSFALTSSAVAVPPDKPGAGIWLMGSEVRRIIELPWNKQTEAVIQTFSPGDLIQVKFNDGSVLNFKVDQVTQVDATDTSVLTDNKPSLVIILAGEKSAQRWVVIARP